MCLTLYSSHFLCCAYPRTFVAGEFVPLQSTATMKTFAWAGAVTLCATAAHGLRAPLSPITRVVELLDGLAKQAAKDGKKEEDLYETYVCWAKTVIDTKTATNEAARSRIDELETYISDLDAG